MSAATLKLGESDGLWLTRDQWPSGDGPVTICFAGRGLPDDRDTAVRSLVPEGVQPAWLEQTHSAAVLAAVPGCAGRGDALITDRDGLAPSVVTADCVPVLLASAGEVAAVHAGWRGVVGEIVGAAVGRFRQPIEVAWIGPAISGEAYEVSPEVADKVIAVSHADVCHEGPRGRPHVDLPSAVAHQLRRAGVRDIRTVEECTFQEPDRLWSYRREGRRAGRNISMIWRQGAERSDR